MKKRKHASGGEGFVHQSNTSSKKKNRNLTWRRKPTTKDHSAISFVQSGRHRYKLGPQPFPQYDSVPSVFPPYVYGAHDIPSYAYGALAYPSHGFGLRYHTPFSNGSCGPPFHGIGVLGPPSHCVASPGPPPHGVKPPCPPLDGVTDPGPLSHGIVAHDLPSQTSRAHGFPSDGVIATATSLQFPAVSLRGLPRNCREIDIIRFFDGLHIVDVFLVFTNKTFSGEAFVVFLSSFVADSALQRDKQKLGGASVEISACRRQDFYVAVAVSVNDGVNFCGSRAQAKSHNKNHPVRHTHDVKSNVVADVDYPENPQGQATSLYDNNVVNHTHKPKTDAPTDSKVHGRPEGEAKSFILGKDQVNHKKIIPGEAKTLLDKDQHILKVGGPPYFADTNVIIGVFGDFDLSEDRVHIVLHPNGTPTGEMYLEFLSQEDAKKAMSKDKTMIGSCLIEIRPATMEDLRDKNTERNQESDCYSRVKKSSEKDSKGPDIHSSGKPKTSDEEEQKVCTQIIKICNVPPSADMYEIIEFFGEFSLTLDRLHVVCGRDGIATGDVYVEFDSVENAKKAMSKDKNMIQSQCVQLLPSSPDEASRSMAESW